METNNLIQRALMKAIKLHAGQFRKDGTTPYIVHPMQDALVVSRHGASDEIIASALLHDTIEDCNYAREEMAKEFGEDIAEIVEHVTEDKTIQDYGERKRKAVEYAGKNENAVFIKIADALVNLQDFLAMLEKEGEDVWKKFHGTKNDRLEYCSAIGDLPSALVPENLRSEFLILINYLLKSNV